MNSFFRKIFSLFLYGMLFFLTFCGPIAPERNWVLVWSDEFDGNGKPDPDKWTSFLDSRCRNNDFGPDGWWSKDDVMLDGQGNLLITVRRIPDQNGDGDPYDYSAGMIATVGNFEQKFGKFEMRCKLPTQPGWWVAFWLCTDSVHNVDGSGEDGTEIDIFEGFGWTDRIQHALHWDGYGPDHKYIFYPFIQENVREGYHTFTLEWDEIRYMFYVDGKRKWSTKWGGVSKVPEYIGISGEICTEEWAISENWANNPEYATFPDGFFVDYVRVYEAQ